MGKKKKPDREEELEQQVRELKSINRQLMKKLKKADRSFKPEQIEEQEEIIHKNICSECTRGEIQEVNLGPRKFKRCTICNWRSKTEKNNG